MVDVNTEMNLLMRGVDVVKPAEALAEKLALGRPLRVKLGLDPTAPAVTLGWAVVLRKLRHFQELGHTAVLIVGDFTAQVGDPSGKSETRRRLTPQEVKGYADQLLGQFQKVLLPEPLEVRYNSEWLGALDMAGVLDLTSKATVAQMLERSDFAKRYGAGSPISIMEFLYPLLQGHDSVAVEADVELGGSDQLWNLMMGRVIQERAGLAAQVAMTMPLLIGTDGEHKMSQSLNNYIGVDEPAPDMFGKTMSIPDELMTQWFSLVADTPDTEVAAIAAGLSDGTRHPGETKRELARRIVALYWGPDAAVEAEAVFDLVHKRREIPDDVPEYRLGADDPVSIPSLLRDTGLTASAGEGRRVIIQGGVRIDGTPIGDVEMPRNALEGVVLQVGKRKFVRLVP
jgi:tyrosyl-tRNA synthetase